MDPKQRNYLLLALCAILVIGSWVLFVPPNTKITQGLDIRGGLSVILTAKPGPGQTLTTDDMDRADLIIGNRVNKLGASETSIQRQGSDSLLVQIPGVKSADQALRIIDETGKLEFVDVSSLPSTTVAAINDWQGKGSPRASAPKLPDNLKYTAVVSGDSIKNATVNQQTSGTSAGQIAVTLSMDSKGTKEWADYTSTHVGKQVAIVLDGVVQSAPVINEPILTGDTEISGKFTVDDAKYLATVLQSGSLPVKLEAVDTRVVGRPSARTRCARAFSRPSSAC